MAFVRSFSGVGGGSQPPRLFAVGADGERLRRVTRGCAAEISPAWAPDGRRIVFARESGRGFALFTVRPNGSELTRITARRARWTDATFPAWSPDGRRILFTAYVEDNEDVYVLDVRAGTASQLLGGPEEDSYAVWAPDGARSHSSGTRTST